MPARTPIPTVAAAIVLLVPSAFPQLAGDFDSDGPLTIRDVIHLHDREDPAPGSLEGFRSHPCFSEWMGDEQLRDGYLTGPT